MNDSDVLILLQELHLAASHVEASLASLLMDAQRGLRPMGNGDIEEMRDMLANAVQQKHQLASGIIELCRRADASMQA